MRAFLDEGRHGWLTACQFRRFQTPLPDLDALSLDELKKLVVQLLVEVTALREENQQLRVENARLKALPKKPKLAPGGMDKAMEPDKRVRTKQARRQRRKRQSGQRTPPVTEERTLVIEAPAGSRRRGFEPFTVQDLILTPQVGVMRWTASRIWHISAM
ncbi:regulator of replication initiation timing [Skermanella aerolata]|uniref:hypothetical protein n=1 Tax=Skermanella aerolata TaxID=393310 RepID=UPI003D2571B4